MLILLVLAAAQPNPYLAQAKLFQQSGDYKSCLRRIEQARKWDNTREEQVDIAIYAGVCNYALLKTKEAESELKLALTLDPAAKLPPYSSPKIVALFESLRPPPSKEPVKEAQKPPPEQQKPPPEQSPPPEQKPATVQPQPAATEPAVAAAQAPPAAVVESSRGVSASFVGTLVFGAFSLASLAVAIVLGVNASSLEGQAQSASFQIDAFNLKHNADSFALAANLSYAIAGAALAAALVLFIIGRAG